LIFSLLARQLYRGVYEQAKKILLRRVTHLAKRIAIEELRGYKAEKVAFLQSLSDRLTSPESK
jgi:hypothetical protein